MKPELTPHFDVFIHGVPNMHEYDREDINFVKFYSGNPNPVETELRLEIRKLGDTRYCYYHYLRHKNIIGYNGRTDSFFGLSLRFNIYYCDALCIYKILDLAFNAYASNLLFKQEGINLKYTIPNFDDKSATDKISKLKESTTRLIQLIFSNASPEKFIQLSSFSIRNEKLPKYYLYDCRNNNLLTTLKQYGNLVISPYFQSESESKLRVAHQNELQSLYNQNQQLKLQYENSLQDFKNKQETELQSERSKYKKLKQEIEQKNKEINGLKDKIKQYTDKIQTIYQLIEPFISIKSNQASGQSSEVPFMFEEKEPYTPHKHKNRHSPFPSQPRHFLLLLVAIFLILFLIVMLLIILL